MPYVVQETRNKLEAALDAVAKELEEMDVSAVDGALNYSMTYLMNRVYAPPYSYFKLNRANGTINSVRDEFYRRVVVPYEEQKTYDNEDVYPNPNVEVDEK